MKKFGIQKRNNEHHVKEVRSLPTEVKTNGDANSNGFVAKDHRSSNNGVGKICDRISARPRVIRRRSFNEENQYKNWCERTLDVFEIIGKIGEGSYGQVYKAKDKNIGEYMSV